LDKINPANQLLIMPSNPLLLLLLLEREPGQRISIDRRMVVGFAECQPLFEVYVLCKVLGCRF
jgi:hypothetical protein